MTTEQVQDPEWEWADRIPEQMLVRGQADGQILLRCKDHGGLYTVGEIELWELALDARRHWREHHEETA